MDPFFINVCLQIVSTKPEKYINAVLICIINLVKIACLYSHILPAFHASPLRKLFRAPGIIIFTAGFFEFTERGRKNPSEEWCNHLFENKIDKKCFSLLNAGQILGIIPASHPIVANQFFLTFYLVRVRVFHLDSVQKQTTSAKT